MHDKQTASKCCFPRDFRIKIQTVIHFIRYRVVQNFVKGRCTRLHWVLRFKFTTQEVCLAAPILGDLHIVLVEFDPNKVTPEPQSQLAASGRPTEWIENYASTDCWQIGLPSYRHRLPRDALSPCILYPADQTWFEFPAQASSIFRCPS